MTAAGREQFATSVESVSFVGAKGLPERILHFFAETSRKLKSFRLADAVIRMSETEISGQQLCRARNRNGGSMDSDDMLYFDSNPVAELAFALSIGNL